MIKWDNACDSAQSIFYKSHLKNIPKDFQNTSDQFSKLCATNYSKQNEGMFIYICTIFQNYF